MKSTYEENYNSPQLTSIWSDFIDWKKRRNGENGFLEKTLRKFGCKKVLDASLGEGCDSIHLLKKGFDVASNEIDSLFIQQALSNARTEGVKLSITSFDWRDFSKKFDDSSFDCIFLLGNSLTYLFSKKDRLKTVSAFKNMLKPGGIFLVDERNYDYILSNRVKILAGDFPYSRKYVYCGRKVHSYPIEIKENKVVMEYDHVSGKTAFLSMYPFKKGELFSLLKEVGFKKISVYSDYEKGYSPKAEFFQYLATK